MHEELAKRLLEAQKALELGEKEVRERETELQEMARVRAEEQRRAQESVEEVLAQLERK